MALLNWRSVALAIRSRRRRLADPRLLRPAEFDQAAAGERMRVDRNGSPLSILLFTLPDPSNEGATRQLAKRLAARLRMTDTAGRLRDGRVGVLLPDTPAEGAWKVASDIGADYPSDSSSPSCEVMVYPDNPPGGEDAPDDDPGGPDAHARPDRKGAADEADPSQVPQVGPAVHARGPATESFFALATPTWKRAIDIAGASFGLLVAAPVIGVAAAAVTLTSRGGPFYAQVREGHGGRRFRIYKIRTMRPGSDRLKDELRKHSEQDGPAFKMTRDPRVTRIGSLLRKTSIDELPQLLNVLRGEMSLVGPRPLQLDESLACSPWQRQRLSVKPGLTCIWQVTGRSVVSFDEWVRMDLDYARRRNLRMDLALILKTPPSLLVSKGPR